VRLSPLVLRPRCKGVWSNISGDRRGVLGLKPAPMPVHHESQMTYLELNVGLHGRKLTTNCMSKKQMTEMLWLYDEDDRNRIS
jgi:hypothetical protein